MEQRRTSVLDKTASIDEVNFNKVDDISTLAQKQLKRFDQTYKQNDAVEHYQKIRESITSSETIDQNLSNEVAYELEIAESEFMPTLREKKEVESKPSASVVLNLRGKLILAVTTSILVLLSILLIYNAALIKSYNADIASSQLTLQEEQARFDSLSQQLAELLEKVSPGTLGMSEFTANQIVSSIASVKGAVETYSTPTNWFDAICNFFSSIFGG